MKTIGRWALGLVPLVLGLVIWELSSTDASISFPPPSTWWDAGRDLWESDQLVPALQSTLTTFAVGMLAASALGILAGVVIGYSPGLERTLTPLIDFFRTLPPPVVVPVLTLLIGINLRAGVAILVVSVVWPILLNTIGAVHEMPSTRREVARMLRLGRVESFVKITLPSLLPGIVVGLRTALSLGLVVTLLVDVIGSSDGIGRLLVIQQQLFNADSVWAILFVIGVIGYALNLIVDGGSRYLLRKHPNVAR